MKNVKNVKTMTQNDQCFAVRITAEELNITIETVSLILMENLGMKKVCAKMMPRTSLTTICNGSMDDRSECYCFAVNRRERWLVEQSHC
jgi:hypothetical protein